MFIGNIVCDTKITVPQDFNLVKDLTLIDKRLPTLIVGWEYVHNNFENYDIFTRYLGEDIFWTFKSTEKRSVYEEDLYKFTRYVYDKIFDNINYYFIDPFLIKKKSIYKIARKILSMTKLITYKHNEMLYLYDDNIMLGMDLQMLDYVGINKYNLTEKIKKISHVFLDKDSIFIEYKERIELLGNKVRFVPIVYSIRNG